MKKESPNVNTKTKGIFIKRVLALVLSLVFLILPFNTAFAETAEKKTVKILAIGSSFMANSASQVRRFSQGDISATTDLLVASCCLGGSTFQVHAKNIKENAKKYGYTRYYTSTDKQENVSINDALTFEEWDYVVIQQSSNLAGAEETFEPYLEEIVKYIKSVIPNVQIVFNQTWAFNEENTHAGYSRYQSQSDMFRKIRETYAKFSAKYSFDILPCAEAFQIARDDALYDLSQGGSSLCIDDGYHANTDGCYLLGAVWYEYFSKRSVWDNTFTNKNIAKSNMYVLKRAAHTAIKRYYTVEGNNDDTYGFLTEVVTSSEDTATTSKTPTATTSAKPTSSKNTTTTSVVTSSESESQDNTSSQTESEPTYILESDEVINNTVQQPNYVLIILITLGVSILIVGGGITLIVVLSSKKKK